MKPLIDLLALGNFNGVTLYETKDGRWQCSVRRKNSDGWEVMFGNTPEEALRQALSGAYNLLQQPVKQKVEDLY